MSISTCLGHPVQVEDERLLQVRLGRSHVPGSQHRWVRWVVNWNLQHLKRVLGICTTWRELDPCLASPGICLQGWDQGWEVDPCCLSVSSFLLFSYPTGQWNYIFFILVSCLCSFAGDFDHYHIQEMIRVKHYFTFLKANLIRLVTHCSKVPFRFRKVVNRSIRELPGFKSLHYVRNIFGTISPVTYNLLVLFLVPKHKRPNLGV